MPPAAGFDHSSDDGVCLRPLLSGRSRRPGLGRDSRTASARPPPAPPFPREATLLQGQNVDCRGVGQLSGLQTDSGSHPAEVCLGKRKPPSLPASVTKPRGQRPPDGQSDSCPERGWTRPCSAWRRFCSKLSSLARRGCCFSLLSPRAPTTTGNQDRQAGNRATPLHPRLCRGLKLERGRREGGCGQQLQMKLRGSRTQRPGPLCPGHFGAAQKRDPEPTAENQGQGLPVDVQRWLLEARAVVTLHFSTD